MNQFPKAPEYIGGKFVAGVADNGGAPWLANISQIFGKLWNGLWGLGETDSWKKPEATISTLSL
jgi:hypothetical protein